MAQRRTRGPLSSSSHVEAPAKPGPRRAEGVERSRKRAGWRPRSRGVAGLAIALLLGCRAPTRPPERVVLITFDTTRADHLGAYGYPRATSPFFDALARRGVLFERAIAPLPTTVPSHATMFTGRYPIEHGVGHNGQRLPPEIPSLAEQFRQRGYSTAAFVSLRLLGRSGLERGFDLVEFSEERSVASLGTRVRRAHETSTAAIEWLRGRRRDARFFLWVHYYDPHWPREPSEAALAAVRRESGGIGEVREHLLGEQGVGLGLFRGDVNRMLDVMERYDGEIRAMDDALRRLYRAFVGFGLDRRSLWVIAGDHGEGLGSHDWMDHDLRLYQEQMRVPLLVHTPEGDWPARRIDDIVELVDLVPTLAELLGGEPPPAARGESLVPHLAGRTTAASDREALVQVRTFEGVRAARPKPDAAGAPGLGADQWMGLVGRRWKYIHSTSGAPELYDLEADPVEGRNLAAERPDLVAAMRERLFGRLRALRVGRFSAEAADERTLEALRALGYLQ